MKSKLIQHLLGALVLAVAMTPASAAQSAIHQQLQQRVDALGKQWSGHDAHAIATQFFTGDLTASGEGNPGLVQGSGQLEPLLAELFKAAPHARLEVHVAEQLGADAAYAWVVWHCNEDKPATQQFKVRSLYVFKKTGGLWKIAADAYSMGGLPR
ncbi:hypothetical protein [Janthinobacterium sp. PC23-8]|uniref:YybH family protein n=1 Tax=Janthinobacterium sp. PC23-8 TaxID=2012679 RepID=UPI000BCFFB51|nr:hypothetical protein [Janthinobacterium sp. PC23-8]OYO27591.1 hypothetical protein CD932_20730 [Janthinobacterium sp. PC23-8]